MINKFKNSTSKIVVALLFGISVVACEKQNISPAPVVDVTLTVRGSEIINTSDSISLIIDSIGIAVYYDFNIQSTATIADVKTIITKYIDAKTSKVDETITSSFTDKTEAVVKGMCFVESIPKELKLVVTDTEGNRSEKAFKVKPIF
jgi:hypothetical protein